MAYVPQIRTKHPSQEHLRRSLNRHSKRCVVRLGSTTTLEEIYPRATHTDLDRRNVVEINTVDAIKNSASKLRMKQCFTTRQVKTADWFVYDSANLFIHENNNRTITSIRDLPYPIVSKSHFGSRGEGNAKHNNEAELRAWMRGKDLSNYIFEKFYNFSREYRLHVTEDGCFYTCRKMLRDGTPDNQKWFRNDSNSVWIMDTNPSFDRPSNWNAIVAECVKALRSTGLDIGGFDVKVQSRLDNQGRVRTNPDFIIIESNSACSHGEVTAVKYEDELNRLITKKMNNNVTRNVTTPTREVLPTVSEQSTPQSVTPRVRKKRPLARIQRIS